MTTDIDETARIVDSDVRAAEVREHVTIHDSEVGEGSRIYERTSIKKSTLGERVDVNAGSYVENARIDPEVQVGPNANVVGVTHDLDERGMTFREDVFEEVVLREGVFVGVGAVVLPGVTVGEGTVVGAGAVVDRDVGPGKVVVGSRSTLTVRPLAEWV